MFCTWYWSYVKPVVYLWTGKFLMYFRKYYDIFNKKIYWFQNMEILIIAETILAYKLVSLICVFKMHTIVQN